MKQAELGFVIGIMGVFISSFLSAQTSSFEDIGSIIWDN